MRQSKLFEEQASSSSVDDMQLMLYALGEFQARGKALAERELPLDRLRGAVRRACEAFGRTMLADESVVTVLDKLGAQVRRVPAFVAKHPFRVTVSSQLAERALNRYKETLAKARQ